ncbi:hypothetical protein ACFLUY_00140 [Chloroflexota bacterium]
MAEEDKETREAENLAGDVKPLPSSLADDDQIKDFEGYLRELENAREKLKAGEIGVEEAKQRLQKISELSIEGAAEPVTEEVVEAEEREEKEAELVIEGAAEPVTEEVVEAEEQEEKEAELVIEGAAEPVTEEVVEAEEREEKEAELVIEGAAEPVTEEVVEAEEREEKEAELVIEGAAVPVAEETRQAREIEDGELYEGELRLMLMSPIDLGQMRKLQQCLYQAQDLRIVLLSGSVDEGTSIVVSAARPIPLIDILREMPPVEQVNKVGSKIQIMLKAE